MKQLQSLTKDVGDLKRGKESATIEKRDRDNLVVAFTPNSKQSYGNFTPMVYIMQHRKVSINTMMWEEKKKKR